MKILIIKTSSLGDIIHAFKALHLLKAALPDAHVDWVVEAKFSSLIKAHPLIDNCYSLDSKKWKKNLFSLDTIREIKQFRNDLQKTNYDWVFDLQGNVKSSFALFFSKSEKKVGFGAQSVPEWPNLLFTHQRLNPPKNNNVRDDLCFLVKIALGIDKHDSTPLPQVKLLLSQDEKNALETILHDYPCDKKKIIIAMGSAWPNKQLATSQVISLLSAYKDKLCFYLLSGSEQEKEQALALKQALGSNAHLLPKLSLAQLQNFMCLADAFIGMDSMPLHLADLADVPTFSFFGPSFAHKYAPKGQTHQHYQGTCPYGKVFDKRCKILRKCETGACLKQAPLNEMQSSLDTFIKKVLL